jgi:neurotransmitter:Na+ symporter, NSS family
MAETVVKSERWATRLGVILAVTGSAVGLGNFLRFPGLAAQYEGGAFMIPYFIALLLLGLPLAWAEWSMGRFGGARGFSSTPGIYRTISKSRLAPYVGVLGLLVPVGIYMFYVLIEAWCLGYAWFYLTGTMAEIGEVARQTDGTLDKSHYGNLLTLFIGAEEHGAAFNFSRFSALPFLAVCFLLNFVLIYRGLTRGIEKFCLWAMPLLVICAIIVLMRVLTLDGILNGLGFMWNPRTDEGGLMTSLLNGKMWLDATGQIFFSLSVGFGIIITYSSYLRPNDDIALSSLTSSAGNEFCEVALGGMITIPAAFIFFGAAVWTGSSFGLGFVTLPMVFELMPLGYVVGFAFFFLLFLAAVTSSLSMLQPAIALLEEGLGLNRRASVSLLGFITLIGAMFVLFFSKGTIALDTFDFWVGTFFIFIVAWVQTILFGWVLGRERGMAELDRGAEIRVPRIIGWMLKYVAPLYLLAIFVFWLYTEITKPAEANLLLQTFRNPVAAMALGFLGLVIILFLLIIAQSVRRWEAAERARGPESGPEVQI